MSAQIIPFPVREVAPWPDGQMGQELERLAQLSFRYVQERDGGDTIEAARGRVLKGYRQMCELLEASGKH